MSSEKIIQEPLTTENVAMLMTISGTGMLILSWNIDYSVGSVRFASTGDRCIWTKKGLRTTVSYGGGTAIISQSKNVDPLYDTLEHCFDPMGTGKKVS